MFGLFKAAKPHTLTIEGVGEFTVNPKETILSAALRQGVRFPYSCKVGGCATCKCQLKTGQIKELTSAAFILSEDDLKNRYVLGCQSQLKSDVTIHVDGLSDGSSAVKSLDGEIRAVERLTHDMVRISVDLPESLSYQPGQYALVSTPAVTSGPRSYSFATPEKGNQIDFFIREVPGGEMSGWANKTAKVGDSVSIDGPYGDFYLRQDSNQKRGGEMLMLAGGSGLAPVLAILEDAMNNKIDRDAVFIYGARTQADLSSQDDIARIARNWSGAFRFVPVLSEEPENSDWEGLRGLVTDVLPELAANVTQTYMCGPPPMLDAAEACLQQHNLSRDGIFCDRFINRAHDAA